MPICLPPPGDKSSDVGVVYEAGWGSTKEKDCTTGDKGPDPFSKCKFPFFLGDRGIDLPLTQCIKTTSPSHGDKGCRSLYKMMKKRKGNTMTSENYGRVNIRTNKYRYSIKSLIRKLIIVFHCKLAQFSYHVYRKEASINVSRLEARFRFHVLLMKVKFDL